MLLEHKFCVRENSHFYILVVVKGSKYLEYLYNALYIYKPLYSGMEMTLNVDLKGKDKHNEIFVLQGFDPQHIKIFLL